MATKRQYFLARIHRYLLFRLSKGTFTLMHEIDSRTLRNVLGQYPTGITVVTAFDSEGSPVGMTANSFASVSLSPPLVLWSVDKNGNTHSAFTEAKNFCIHFLREDQEDLSRRFSSVAEDRFESVEWGEGKLGSPLLNDYLCRIECLREAVYPGGDHSIIMGRVVNVEANSHKKPLLFHQGTYRILGDQTNR